MLAEPFFLHSILCLTFGGIICEVVYAAFLDRLIVDDGMARIVQHMQLYDNNFLIKFCHSLALVFHTNRDGISQLIISKGGGLHWFLCKELYCTPFGRPFSMLFLYVIF